MVSGGFVTIAGWFLMIHKFIRTHITQYPFENKHILKIILKELEFQARRVEKSVRIVDPFARQSWLTTKPQGTIGITNDLNPDFATDYHMEANDFCELMKSDGKKFDLILWDPPYNLSQLKRQYQGIGKELELWQCLNPFGRAKAAIVDCLEVGGSIISLGFGSRGFGEYRGVDRVAIYNLEPSGTEYRYNIQVTVERKLQTTLQFDEDSLQERQQHL